MTTHMIDCIRTSTALRILPRSLVAGLCLQVATTHFIAAAANFSVPRILSAHGFLGVALALLVPG